METTVILPVLDTQKLQEKANEFAMLGAVKTLEEYYSGYNSPFRKKIEQELEKTKIGSGIELPDIIALINASLTKEIDLIANTAIAKTFVPLVQRFLVREKKEMNFSEILEEFIRSTEAKYDEVECYVEESEHEWLNVKLVHKEQTYELTLHHDWDAKKKGIKLYQLLSLPYNVEKYAKKMVLSIDGATLELPFTGEVLHNQFISFIAGLVIANSKITMDCRDFNETMFPEDECHCN